jgi:chromosomal replication initiator protein
MELDLTTTWTKVLAMLEKDVSRGNFITVLKPTHLVSLDDGIATVAAPSPMLIDLLQKRFTEKIKEHLDAITNADTSVLFIVKSLPQSQQADVTTSSPLFAADSISNISVPVAPMVIGHLPRVRPDFTFQTFAVSDTNQLAFVSSNTVATHPGTSYNPFFIYGPVGVGKTHLMHAIANHVYQRNPDKKIIYTTSEEFTNEVIDAIRNNETSKMKRRFRTAMLLLIDDIQFIEGKDKVQEELFHTFNILIDQGAQIVLTSDRPPEEIKRLEKRLSSRFAGGLTVDIEAPSFELKTAILQKKAEKFSIELPIDVAKILADSANDTRTLEGLLLRVITLATTQALPVSKELALRALGKAVEEERGHLHAEDVINAVCEFYRIKQTQLKGPKRDASLVRARQITMYLLKTELRLTHAEIGNLLGGRDHTTVMHGVDKMVSLVENKAGVTEDITGITRSLRG